VGVKAVASESTKQFRELCPQKVNWKHLARLIQIGCCRVRLAPDIRRFEARHCCRRDGGSRKCRPNWRATGRLSFQTDHTRLRTNWRYRCWIRLHVIVMLDIASFLPPRRKLFIFGMTCSKWPLCGVGSRRSGSSKRYRKEDLHSSLMYGCSGESTLNSERKFGYNVRVPSPNGKRSSLPRLRSIHWIDVVAVTAHVSGRWVSDPAATAHAQ
jgi:hypothetical protein